MVRNLLMQYAARRHAAAISKCNMNKAHEMQDPSCQQSCLPSGAIPAAQVATTHMVNPHLGAVAGSWCIHARLPVSQQKSRHSRCSSRCSAEATHERASGSKAHAHAKPHAVAPSAHPPWSAQTIPASCRNPASRHSRCSAQACASGLAGAGRVVSHSRSTRNTPRNLAASRGEGGGEAA